jgi:hypothetical protein
MKSCERYGEEYALFFSIFKMVKRDDGKNVRMRPHYNWCQVFTSGQEKDLAKNIFVCTKVDYGLRAKRCINLQVPLGNQFLL